MALSYLHSAALVASVGIALYIRRYLDWRRRNPARLPYPPGPKGYPVIGNLLDVPPLFLYKRFKEIGTEIGAFPAPGPTPASLIAE